MVVDVDFDRFGLFVRVIWYGYCLRSLCNMKSVEFYFVIILIINLWFISFLFKSNFCFVFNILEILFDWWKNVIILWVLFKILLIFGKVRVFFIIRLILCL